MDVTPFWDIGEEAHQALAAIVDGQVYAAIAEMLAEPPNADFLIEAPWPGPGGWPAAAPCDGWGLRLTVEGRGRADIERFIDIAALIRDEIGLDSRRNGTIEPEAAGGYRLLAERLRASAEHIEAALAESERASGRRRSQQGTCGRREVSAVISNRVLMVASDYAVLYPTESLRLYYGYEVTEHNLDDEGEWCFQAKRGGIEVLRIPCRELPGKPDMFDVVECLLAGVAAWISKTEAGG